jgi:hypothetical protein
MLNSTQRLAGKWARALAITTPVENANRIPVGHIPSVWRAAV